MESEKPEGSSSRISPVMLAVLLLGVGGVSAFGVWWFQGGGASEEPPAEAEEAAADGHDPKAETAGGHGRKAKADGGGHGGDAGGEKEGEHGPVSLNQRGRAVVTLGKFTVNLRGSGGGRVLRAEVQLEVDQASQNVVLEEQPALRDAVLTLSSDYTYSDLEGIDGKTHLRDEIFARVSTLLDGQTKVHRVYFTEFVVQ